MTKKNYNQGQFQKTYIQRCVNIGHPLDEAQIGELEDTVNRLFGFRHIKNITPQHTPLVDQLVDRSLLLDACRETDYKRVSSLIKHIQSYIEGEDYEYRYREEATDAKALALYRIGIKMIDISNSKDPFKDSSIMVWSLRKQIGISNYREFKALHAYLHKRGLIQEKTAPLPKKLRQ